MLEKLNFVHSSLKIDHHHSLSHLKNMIAAHLNLKCMNLNKFYEFSNNRQILC